MTKARWGKERTEKLKAMAIHHMEKYGFVDLRILADAFNTTPDCVHRKCDYEKITIKAKRADEIFGWGERQIKHNEQSIIEYLNSKRVNYS